jgi:hypothetical protein
LDVAPVLAIVAARTAVLPSSDRRANAPHGWTGDGSGRRNVAGWHEGRNPNRIFNTSGYLSHNADVAAGMNPLDHSLMFGIYEGRTPVSDGVWS